MEGTLTTGPAEPAPGSDAERLGGLWVELKELYTLVEHIQNRTAEVAAKLLGAPLAVSREDLERLGEALTQAQERLREAQAHLR